MNTKYNSKICELPDGYKPSNDEPFMNEKQLEYFRRKLLDMESEIQDHIINEFQDLEKTYNLDISNDKIDKASIESEYLLHFKTKTRAEKLLQKIRYALSKIKNGTYGYCEVTGKPIDIARLEIRPTATLCRSAQEEHEKNEKLNKR